MDMAFITPSTRPGTFPPHDPWMSGETLNYYYFGHVVLAWPIKLLGLAPDAGYLLAWGALMGLTATAVYAFAGTLWAAAPRGARRARAARRAGVRRARGRGAGGDPRQPRGRPGVDQAPRTRRATTPGSTRRG